MAFAGQLAVTALPASSLCSVPTTSRSSEQPEQPEQPESSQEPRLVEPYALARASASDSQVARTWSPLGTIDAGVIADCDPAGLIQMRGETWSMDWWIGAEDRWHYPSSDAAVRQRRIGDSPVIETAMRVPGGDVVQRAFGVRATSAHADGSLWDDSAVVIEIENLTAVPVALALVLRPFELDAPGVISSLESQGSVLSVDGRVAAVLSKVVARRVVGDRGTVATRLSQADDEDPDGIVTLPSGLLEGAFVVALPHTAVVRILLPRSTRAAGSNRRRKGSKTDPSPTSHWEAPDAAAIEAGWAAHTKDAARVELPDSALEQVVTASERVLLLAATDEFFATVGPSSSAVRAAELCDALVRVGVTEPLGPLARALLTSLRVGGAVRMPDRSDASVALIHASVALLCGKRQELWAEELVGPVAKAIHRLSKGSGLEGGSLVRSAAIALGRVAPSLRVVGQPEVAEAAEDLAGRLWDSEAQRQTATLAELQPSPKQWMFSEGASLRSALASSQDTALSRILEFSRIGDQAVLPDCLDAHGLACGEIAIDPAAIAVRLAVILDLALIEDAHGLVILPAFTDAWFGASIEAHGLRTRWGVASFAIRWHGERPAVLWEVIPDPGVDTAAEAPLFTAPGLDPQWSGRGWTGDALLAASAPAVLAPSQTASSESASSESAPSESAPTESAPSQTETVRPLVAPGEGDSFT